MGFLHSVFSMGNHIPGYAVLLGECFVQNAWIEGTIY